MGVRLLRSSGARLLQGGVSRRFTEASTTQGLRTRGTNTLLVDLAAFTVAFWICRTATPAALRTFAAADDNGSQRGWKVGLTATGTVQLRQPWSTADKVMATSAAMTTDRWTHVAVRDSNTTSTAASTCSIAVDGATVATTTADGTGTHPTGTAQNLTIGNSNNAAGTGPLLLAHFAVWSYVVPTSLLSALTAGASPLDFPYGLRGYWPMDGRMGHGVEPDLSGNGFDVFPFSASYVPAWGQPAPFSLTRPRRSRVAKAAAAPSTLVDDDAGSWSPPVWPNDPTVVSVW